MDYYSLQGKSLPVPLKSIEVLHHKPCQDHNSPVHSRDVQAFHTCNGDVINDLVHHRFDQSEVDQV